MTLGSLITLNLEKNVNRNDRRLTCMYLESVLARYLLRYSGCTEGQCSQTIASDPSLKRMPGSDRGRARLQPC